MSGGAAEAEAVTLVCDVDHTVLHDDASTARLAGRLAPLRRSGRLRFVLNSSRFVRSIAASVRDTPLAEPDFVIGGMGTEIRRWDAGAADVSGLDIGEAWTARLGQAFDAATIDRLIRDAAADENGFRVHDTDSLSPLKRSFDWPAAAPAALDALSAALSDAGQRAKVIYSSNLHCDVIPTDAGKGAAMMFLVEQSCWPADRVVACGDSGNDAEMLLAAAHAVAVANAQPELKRLTSTHLHHATAEAGDGVWEGLLHHFPELSL